MAFGKAFWELLKHQGKSLKHHGTMMLWCFGGTLDKDSGAVAIIILNIILCWVTMTLSTTVDRDKYQVLLQSLLTREWKLTQCWFNVGPPSTTLAQQWASIVFHLCLMGQSPLTMCDVTKWIDIVKCSVLSRVTLRTPKYSWRPFILKSSWIS